MMLKYILALLLLCSCCIVSGQSTFEPTKIRENILSLTNRFDKYNDSVEYLPVVYDGIFKKATEAELYELTDHPNPLVRRSSFYKLLERNSARVVTLLHKNASDTVQYFNIQYGCFLIKQTFLDELLYYLSPESGWDKKFKMTSAQKHEVLAMILKRESDRSRL
jgi:hypothetical protein